jgi:two-component sensor histidine kinase
LAASHWGDVDLRWLAERLVEGLRLGSASKVPINIEGPRVMIAPQQARPVAMTLCELFTNSCKYGAHSKPGGRVQLRWESTPGSSSAPGETVQLRWSESGGPRVAKTPTPRLGVNLIRGFIEYDLHGRCTLRFRPQGVDHLFEFSAGGDGAGQSDVSAGDR